jgi:hypothetical protein
MLSRRSILAALVTSLLLTGSTYTTLRRVTPQFHMFL